MGIVVDELEHKLCRYAEILNVDVSNNMARVRRMVRVLRKACFESVLVKGVQKFMSSMPSAEAVRTSLLSRFGLITAPGKKRQHTHSL